MAAKPGGGFEQGDVEPRCQAVCGCQPGDTRADHGDTADHACRGRAQRAVAVAVATRSWPRPSTASTHRGVAERSRGNEGGRREEENPPGISAGDTDRLRDEKPFDDPGNSRRAHRGGYDGAVAAEFPAKRKKLRSARRVRFFQARRGMVRAARYEQRRSLDEGAARPTQPTSMPQPMTAADAAKLPVLRPRRAFIAAMQRLNSFACRLSHDLSRAFQAARSGALEHGPRYSVGSIRRRAPFRRAGADGEDERDHRMGRAAGDRDVPSRQPRRQRFLGIHERLVLRGAEALARSHGVSAPLPARARAQRGRAARGALRFRSGSRARDVDAALLRRDPPQPLVSARRRVAQRAGHQGDLRNPGPRRGRGTAAPTCAT